MIDRYLPPLDQFLLSEEEQNAVAAALLAADPWSWKSTVAQAEAIASAKEKIRDYHLARHRERCCYCRANLHGAGYFMTDREHVLPKSVDAYRSLSYTMWNLGMACKRCNMEYKKSKIDFVVEPGNNGFLTDSANYRFIHPNFDLYSEHMLRESHEAEDGVIVKYLIVSESEKGAYTYNYFNLRGLEVDSFDRAQGLNVDEEVSVAALDVRSLADDFGQ